MTSKLPQPMYRIRPPTLRTCQAIKDLINRTNIVATFSQENKSYRIVKRGTECAMEIYDSNTDQGFFLIRYIHSDTKLPLPDNYGKPWNCSKGNLTAETLMIFLNASFASTLKF